MPPQIIGFDSSERRLAVVRRRLRVSAQLAWRILVHEKGRTALALIGVFIAILLIFIELGFFIAVPQGGMLVYDHMRFDLLLVSSDYQFQAQPWQFPRARLTEASAVAGIAGVTPLYFGGGSWRDSGGGLRLDVFLIGCDPKGRPFAVTDIERQSDVLARTDTILVDDATRPIFGSLATGTKVDIDGRTMTIGGTYRLGTGFLGLGIAVMDEANFFRLTHRGNDPVNFGLITLAPGADLATVAAALRQKLPTDVQVFTRASLTQREEAYWTIRTSVGLMFGSGLVVSLIVGLMVLYQTLATQIARHLPEFATLKAIGYGDASLAVVVIVEAVIVVTAAFIPATAAAIAVYGVIRDQTRLPVAINATNISLVLAGVLIMSVGSAFLSLSALRRADPAEIF
ncbi:MAG TPA: FtsX-like permease family protein [Stellaceae bacterium]|nr:FtsX-like permease family protein [Stellaceae bacterium]